MNFLALKHFIPNLGPHVHVASRADLLAEGHHHRAREESRPQPPISKQKFLPHLVDDGFALRLEDLAPFDRLGQLRVDHGAFRVDFLRFLLDTLAILFQPRCCIVHFHPGGENPPFLDADLLLSVLRLV